MQHIYDMIIIGGGPAGYTAALYAARAGMDVAILERMSVGGQMALTGTIDNYPGFDEGIDGFTLGMKMQQGAEKYGAKTIYGEATAVKLKGTTKEIITAEETLLAKTVVIATGANPRELGLEGERELVGRGVAYCAACDGMFYKGKTVIVVGGGNSAAADALLLSRVAKKVYLVHRRDTLRATKIYHEPLMQADNVELVLDSEVVQLLAEDRLSGALIRNVHNGEVTQINAEGLFVSVGRKPASYLFAGQVETDESGYIIADETTKTNLPGVYAVGDVRVKRLRQVVTAVADGAAAVHEAEEYIAGH
jgi:thioredoxin reductase (NADPH)